MNHKDYIGRTIGDLLKDTPSFAVNYYLVNIDGKYKHLTDLINDEQALQKTIIEISDLCSDYTYWVETR